jgi:methionine synthase II (cobalamin-independent)
MQIETTVIGSFPRLNRPLHEAMEYYAKLQTPYVDVISDAEQRADMITYFEQIDGLKRRPDKKFEIVGKINPLDNVDDFYKIVDFKEVRSILDSLNKRNVKVKITLTGPITLGMTCALGGVQHYENLVSKELYSDLSEALLPIAYRALELGAYLQVDEPGVSSGYVSPEYANEILEPFFSSLPDAAIDEGRVSMHLCGRISKRLYPQLLDLDCGILSLEFSGKKGRENIPIISSKSLKEHHKKLGIGFMSNVEVEDRLDSLATLYIVGARAGPENIAFLHPGCGFASTPPENVKPILKNMKRTSDAFIQRLDDFTQALA